MSGTIHLSVQRFLVSGAIALAACGGDTAPLVCPAGSTPTGGVCVADDGGTGTDAGRPDGDAAPADIGVDMSAPDLCVPGPDEPDSDGIDSNCDGIDGVADASIFVATSGSDDAVGSIDAPVATIARGIERAMAASLTHVLVSRGTYDGSVLLAGGVGVYGDYDAASGWERLDDADVIVRSTGPVLVGSDITIETVVDRLQFEAADAAAGANSVGARFVRASGVVLRDVRIVAGRGGDGASAVTPAPAAMGADGMVGGMAVRSGSCTGSVSLTAPARGAGAVPACGCSTGGRGGVAGGFLATTGLSVATAGTAGTKADAPSGMFGCAAAMADGTPGPAGAPGAGGMSGGIGSAGMPGTDGAGASGFGMFTADSYVANAAGSGSRGSVGGGGGGGGGGSLGCEITNFCQVSGGAGGGGGAGGCAGSPGSGGGSGGASVAVQAWEATPRFERVSLEARAGGSGGAGAAGGAGGMGGRGQPGGAGITDGCARTSPRGGPGANGGIGGTGGAGGGGAGGPSIGIVVGGGATDPSGTIAITVGSGGAAGAGGGTTNAGTAGDVQMRLVVP